jgi:hypothetical protein
MNYQLLREFFEEDIFGVVLLRQYVGKSTCLKDVSTKLGIPFKVLRQWVRESKIIQNIIIQSTPFARVRLIENKVLPALERGEAWIMTYPNKPIENFYADARRLSNLQFLNEIDAVING